MDGSPLEGLFTGIFTSTARVQEAEAVTITGSFDGTWAAGVQAAKVDDRPWWVPIKGFQPLQPGEHPRILFRKSDLPRLKKAAETPEGKAILERLRKTLGGGEAMPTAWSKSVRAYEGASKNLPVGAYTISHVVGFGLLYQLTGDKKYADLGYECFQWGFKNIHDIDDRYSWKNNGGPLRAGPSMGWYAVGYDLCYDGWDDARREEVCKAIATYNDGDGAGEGKKDLDALTRGTMPPGSNHYGMQVGGAALALMAVTGDKGVDQARIDKLLQISELAMVRNMTEGFGDGGFFAEGDGTGSMSSSISFISALKGWGNAMGRDYFNVERPNANMLTLKWVYLTQAASGRPQFWPIRGTYGGNVWDRDGVSGAGYFAKGVGAVSDAQRPAVKWYYEKFLLPADTRAGGPYDTVSPYPHIAASSFVNWPFDQPGRNPAEVLPLCYRDSIMGCYAWRNRWQDQGDVIASILTSSTQGYMGAGADGALCINAAGKQYKWGKLGGAAKSWWMSPKGEASVLTVETGSLAVDFTGAGGADAMLVTTAKVEDAALGKGTRVKLGATELTFTFFCQGDAPAVTVEGDKAVVGKQTVTLKDGNLVLGVTAK